MTSHSHTAVDFSPRIRSATPPPIQTAIEYLSTSSLVQNIAILLSIPRESSNLVPSSKTEARIKRLNNTKRRARSSNHKSIALSPTIPQQHNIQNSLSVPQSPIDTLAAVASAERLANGERPAKRARSEMLASPDHPLARYPHATHSRPATSYLAPNSWGANVEAKIDSGHLLASPRIDYTRDEKLVADSLLDLFRHIPPAPALLATPAPTVKDDALLGKVKRPAESNALGISSGITSSTDPDCDNSLVSGGQALQRGLGQVRTPPEDQPIEYDAQPRNESQKSLGLEPANNGLLSHVAQPEQLRSPQSLSTEFVKSKANKRRGRIKRESASHEQGLGISVSQLKLQHGRNGEANFSMSPAMVATNGLGDATSKPENKATIDEETKCVACGFFANSITGDTMDWLQCNGCMGWLHFACTGFSKKEIERIDKFHCNACRPKYGPTTFVRKSSRNRTNVDYSSLNEGFFSTVEEHHEHRYVKHFKARDMKHIQTESFPRLAPEDLTLDYLQRLPAMDEPIVIPAAANPRPWTTSTVLLSSDDSQLRVPINEEADDMEQEIMDDLAQDQLGMVIPAGLTVRRVAEIHGPEMPLEVIDVKLQEGDSRKWTLGKWADYYESPGDKAIRNVISLEVSYSPLGKLLRRPKVVRDLDLQDAVWPDSDLARKAVKFYVLMSVADCYTDFHVDFGGSSVYYHVLKGKKVFFFIPPTKQNLKKYEEWCISPAQSETFLPDQTKECYRIDLEAGDTLIIPSGWIHAVWTPEDSLVVGGNFLTKLHIGMQLRINDLEKNTGVETKFRYPFFQKVQWYTVAKYLEDDPLPSGVENDLLNGIPFPRTVPVWQETVAEGQDTATGDAAMAPRYYAKPEVEGWPDLLRFIFRTVLIHLDRLEGISKKTRAAVSRSIPKIVNDPLAMARQFACWIAWKNGNEQVADWVLPNSVLPTRLDVKLEKPQKAALAESRPTRRAHGSAAESKMSHRLGPKKVVCELCREKKVACKHVDAQTVAKMSDSDSASPVEDSKDCVVDGDGVVTKQRDREIVGRLSLNADGKRRWGKACVECRRSKVSSRRECDNVAELTFVKRRCIHDETGKIDPFKQRQLAEAPESFKLNDNELDDEYFFDAPGIYESDEMEIDPALLIDSELPSSLQDAGNDLVQQLMQAASEHASATSESAAHQSTEGIISNDRYIHDNAATVVEDTGNPPPILHDARNGMPVTTAVVETPRRSKTPKRPSPASNRSRSAQKRTPSPLLNRKPRKESKERTLSNSSVSLEEEQSLKIAMELQAQEFGLRSRRSGG